MYYLLSNSSAQKFNNQKYNYVALQKLLHTSDICFCNQIKF